MQVRYIADVTLPEFLRGTQGDERDLDESHALRLWGDGYVELVGDLPDGFEPLSAGKDRLERRKARPAAGIKADGDTGSEKPSRKQSRPRRRGKSADSPAITAGDTGAAGGASSSDPAQ